MGKKLEINKIEDLERLCYGPDRKGKNVSANELTQYNDFLRTKIITPKREEYIRDLFSSIGIVKRIPKNENKTCDFVIEKRKIMIEVTSINIVPTGEQNKNGDIPSNMPANENEFIERINNALKYTKEKNDIDQYLKVAVVFYDLLLNKCYKMNLLDSNFIRKTNFLSSPIDALIFLSDVAGGEIDLPSKGYAKEQKMVDILSELEEFDQILLGDQDENYHLSVYGRKFKKFKQI